MGHFKKYFYQSSYQSPSSVDFTLLRPYSWQIWKLISTYNIPLALLYHSNDWNMFQKKSRYILFNDISRQHQSPAVSNVKVFLFSHSSISIASTESIAELYLQTHFSSLLLCVMFYCAKEWSRWHELNNHTYQLRCAVWVNPPCHCATHHSAVLLWSDEACVWLSVCI